MDDSKKTKLFDLATKQNPIKPLIVQVFTKTFETKNGTTQKGKPYEFHTMQAYLHNHEKPYPNEFTIQFSDQKDILPIGFYSWDPTSAIGFSGFGTLLLDDRKINLLPIAEF